MVGEREEEDGTEGRGEGRGEEEGKEEKRGGKRKEQHYQMLPHLPVFPRYSYWYLTQALMIRAMTLFSSQ